MRANPTDTLPPTDFSTSSLFGEAVASVVDKGVPVGTALLLIGNNDPHSLADATAIARELSREVGEQQR